MNHLMKRPEEVLRLHHYPQYPLPPQSVPYKIQIPKGLLIEIWNQLAIHQYQKNHVSFGHHVIHHAAIM